MKLLDFAGQEALLEASANPFARVVLAHLKARETRDSPDNRHDWKIRLVRGLYERGLGAKDVRELFRLIDWMMVLPKPLNRLFWQEVDKIQQEKQMPFITSIEQVGLCRGLCMGIESMLRSRFGDASMQLMPEIRAIYEEEKLEAILKALETAASPDEVRSLWSAGTP